MRRPRFFYGWWIVLAAGAGHFASVGFASVLFAAVLRPMTAELDWTRAEFTFASSAAAILTALIGPLIGPQIDRHGPRPLMLIGVLGYGATLLATASVNALWQFVALQLLAGVVARPLVGGIVVNVAVSKWFVVRRGWAISLASSGFSFGTMLMPAIATSLVASLGWRDAFVAMALLFWLVMIPAALLMRSSPEEYGLLPDGRSPEDAQNEQGRREIAQQRRDFDASFTPREATRTASFWLLLIAFSLFVATNITLLFHGIAFVSGAGFDAEQAGLAFGITGISGLLSKFAWGWALGHGSPRPLSAAAFACAGGGTALLLLATRTDSLPVLLLALGLWGFGFGGVTPLSEYMWATYFGRRHLGAVRGLGVPAQVAATALGPLLVALWFDATGSYEGAFVGMVLVYLAGAALLLPLRPPRPVAVVPAATAVEVRD